VIVDLVPFRANGFQPSALNQLDPAQRRRENGEHWNARDNWKPDGQTQHALTGRNHTGALKRTRRVSAPNGAGYQRIHDDDGDPFNHPRRSHRLQSGLLLVDLSFCVF